MKPGELVIRAVEERDHVAIHEILTSPHVIEGSMRVPYTPLEQTRRRLTPRPGLYQLAAEVGGEVVGFGELVTHPEEPRERHVGEINMVATRADRVAQGVGRALAEALIDLGENWLGLSRLWMIVFTDNARAIALYESLGFEHEGTMRRMRFGPRTWTDAHVMARLRDL